MRRDRTNKLEFSMTRWRKSSGGLYHRQWTGFVSSSRTEDRDKKGGGVTHG